MCAPDHGEVSVVGRERFQFAFCIRSFFWGEMLAFRPKDTLCPSPSKPNRTGERARWRKFVPGGAPPPTTAALPFLRCMTASLSDIYLIPQGSLSNCLAGVVRGVHEVDGPSLLFTKGSGVNSSCCWFPIAVPRTGSWPVTCNTAAGLLFVLRCLH